MRGQWGTGSYAARELGGYLGAVSPFARVVVLTAAAAAAAVALVVGVVALQTDPVDVAAPAPKARRGRRP